MATANTKAAKVINATTDFVCDRIEPLNYVKAGVYPLAVGREASYLEVTYRSNLFGGNGKIWKCC